MQHIYATLAAALLATASFAQTAPKKAVATRPILPTSIRAMAKLAHTPVKAKNHTYSSSSTVAQGVITEQPEGTLKSHYYRSGKSFVDIMGSIADQTIDGFWGKLVESPDGKHVYIQNPINAYFSDSWVMTTRTTGDTLELQLPVHFCHEEYSDGTVQDGYLYRLHVETVTDPDYGTYKTFVPDDNQLAKFVYRNDTLFFVNTTKDSKLLGMCDETGQWYGYGDYVLQFDPFHQSPVAPKSTEGATKMSVVYSESGQFYGKVLTAVEEGNDIYLAGLCPNLPNAWVKGTKSGNKLTFESGQYMGIDSVTQSYNFFEAIKHVPTYYDYGDGTGDYFDEPYIDSKIEFTRAEGMDGYSYSADSTFYVNQGYHQANSVALYDQPVLTPWEDKAYLPVNPENFYYEPYTEDLGYGMYSFIVSEFATSGEVLDRSKLFYNVIIDGDPYTFSPEDYPSLTEPMTDIPFDFTDLADFTNYAGVFNVNLYIEGYSKIGVQVVYKGGDKVTKSDVIYYEDSDDPESVHTATSALAGATSLGYTDLSGRRVSKPVHGVFIQTLRLANGNVKSVKRVIK